MARLCDIEDCENIHQAKGLCKKHYKRQDSRHREYAKEWRLKNLERARVNSKNWADANRDKVRESNRKYYQRNKSKYEIYWAERRANQAMVYRETWNRREIADRDNWTCQLCGQAIEDLPKSQYRDPMYLNIDHIVPLSKGGDDAPSNLQATHAHCNKSKWVNEIV